MALARSLYSCSSGACGQGRASARRLLLLVPRGHQHGGLYASVQNEHDNVARGGAASTSSPVMPRTRWSTSIRRAPLVPRALGAAELSTLAAAAASPLVLHFTPASALVGGLVLGVATSAKLLTTGRVLGISGAFKGFVNNDAAPWRAAFLGGMTAGGFLLAAVVPGALEALPESFPLARTALAGLLVGAGASMGNGCTSGHGICGNARASVRSAAYTATFMAAGAATATLAHTADALSIAPVAPSLQAAAPAELMLAAAATAAAAVGFFALATLAKRRTVAGAAQAAAGKSTPLELVAEALAGLLFAVGLGVSGMTHATKVAGFLSVTHPGWDLSLPFVMGGAVLVAAVAFQIVARSKSLQPAITPLAFCIPNNKTIDAKLILGGVMFGAGWGLAGLCPGPALVNVAALSPHTLAYLASMMAGMWLEARFGGKALALLLAQPRQTQQQQQQPQRQ